MHRNLLLVPFEPWHVEVLNIREEQSHTMIAMEKDCNGLENYGIMLKEAASLDVDGNKTAWTVLDKGFPVVSGGIYGLMSHVGQAWLLVSNDMLNMDLQGKITIVRLIRKQISKSLFKRIQADTEVSFGKAQRFLELLGFKNEGTMRSYNPDGSDSYLYGYVRSKNVR